MPTQLESRSTAKLAPRWHTGALVLLIVTVAVIGVALTQSTPATLARSSGSNRLIALYLPAAIVNLTLAIYVLRIGRNEWAFWLFGARPQSPSSPRWRDIVLDLALASFAFVAIEGCEIAWANVARRASASSSPRVALLPATPAEHGVWIGMAILIGVCEELVYRGYLQTQLVAFLRSVRLGIVAQAILFGLAHLDQGAAAAMRFAIYACGFGALAWWRRSLVPGIVCHVAIDVFSSFA